MRGKPQYIQGQSVCYYVLLELRCINTERSCTGYNKYNMDKIRQGQEEPDPPLSPLTPSPSLPPGRRTLQVETLGAQLAHLERLLARYDCRGRRLPPLQRSPADQQGEDALPNALEDILAFQGKAQQPSATDRCRYWYTTLLFGISYFSPTSQMQPCHSLILYC